MKWYTTTLIVKDEKGEMKVKCKDYAEDKWRAIDSARDYMIARGYSVKRLIGTTAIVEPDEEEENE